MKNWMWILLAVILPGLSLAGEQETYMGEAQFEAEKEFSSDFSKALLKKQAFQDAITKALKDMELEERLLWGQYDQKFQAYFSPVQKRFQETYPVSRGDQFPQAFKLKKFQEENGFFERSRLSRVISSYVIKETGPVPGKPQTLFMRLEAKVNRSMLNKIYYEWVGGKKFRQIKNLFLTVDIIFPEEDWSLAGVKSKEELISLLEKSWKKWLDQKLGMPAVGTVIARGDLVLVRGEKGDDTGSIENVIQVETRDNDEKIREGEGEGEKEVAKEKITDVDFSSSLWLKVLVTMRKTKENLILKRRQFSFSTDVLLVDLSNDLPILFEEIKTGSHEYSYADNHELASGVAGLLYRTPLTNFAALGDLMKGLPNNSQKQEITINSFEDFSTLFELKEFLDMKGTNIQLRSQILSYGLKEAQLRLSYEGEQKQFKDFLNGLESKTFGRNLSISIPNKEEPLRLNIKSN